MKYVISWETRPGITEEASMRSWAVFSKWTPQRPDTFKEFLGRLDGNGGFAVVDTDDPTQIAKDTAPFTPFIEFHVYPCLEIADQAAMAADGIAFLQSVS